MLVWEVMFGNECPNKIINKAKRNICNKCKYKENIYWTYVICKECINKNIEQQIKYKKE